MGLFTKKEEKKDNSLPDLPQMPDLPNLPSPEESPKPLEKPEIRNLPPLPSDARGIEAIKSNVSSPNFGSFKQEQAEKRTIELGEFKSSTINSITPDQVRNSKKTEPVFIKLDKFKEASKSFDNIKIKLREIDLALTKVKDLKEKENEELKAWESEMQAIKAKIDSIDTSLFNKIGEY